MGLGDRLHPQAPTEVVAAKKMRGSEARVGRNEWSGSAEAAGASGAGETNTLSKQIPLGPSLILLRCSGEAQTP